MFFRKETPKSGTARLSLEMASIADQAIANAKSLGAGHALSQFSHTETETLFAEKNDAGETIYNHYHFTEDMNQLDPEAQVHLMQFFGQVLTFNELLNHPGVEKRLDWIVANASFFERFFARADVSTDILLGRPTEDIERKMRALVEADLTRINQVLSAMFDPAALSTLVPRQKFPFMAAVTMPFEEGQKFINGVYFSAQAAPAVMNWLASLQAQAMQDNNPAHA